MGKFEMLPSRVYASEERCAAAVERAGFGDLRYCIVYRKDGRCFPVFPLAQGEINAVARGVHHKFNVIG